eukprot:TRINITY_DN4321_c0_g1_i1.p1 TRINITY_DN4321_c0_g1~~TRINITY_DN4321_c0_g1_i1.p1  ORF type:complete len:1000 (+),score=336.52 TRINITY_DN4321_c0_g1_i1:121-3120(+)
MPITVAVRPRPLLEQEKAKNQTSCLELATGSEAAVRISRDGEPKCYFNKVFDPVATQDDVYEAVGKPAVADVLNGTSAAIFAYGQTGSGKTYTLGIGDDKGTITPGIQQRAIQDIFAEQSRQRDAVDITVEVEYVQIYKEDMLDLLNPGSERLDIRVTADASTVIEGAEKKSVADEAEFRDVVEKGDRTRRAALYEINASTARAHAILLVTVRSVPRGAGPSKEATLYLVDLAGSERGRVGEIRENAAINRSITVLGIVVHGIANGESHIPYRDSKLTRVLQPCLSGKGNATILLTLNPTAAQAAETAMSLKFGVRAMKGQEQLTLEDYKARVQDLQVYLVQLRAENTAKLADFRHYESVASDLHERCAAAHTENVEKDTKLSEREDTIRKEIAEEHRSLLVSYENQLGMQQDNIEEELETLQRRNAARLAAGEAARLEKQAAIEAETERIKEEHDERLEALQQRNAELREAAAADDGDLPDEEALKKKLIEARTAVEDLRYKIRDCTPSKYASMTLLKLKDKIRKLQSQRKSLIATKKDLKYIQDDQARTRAFLRRKNENPDSDSSEAGSVGTYGDHGSIDSSFDGIPSLPPQQPTYTAASIQERMAQERREREAQQKAEENLPVVNAEIEAQVFKKVETAQLRKALTHEASLRELIEYILQYLEHGCPVWVVSIPDPIRDDIPAFEKRFMYLAPSREEIFLCGVGKNGQPDRQVTQIIRQGMIEDVALGQYTSHFAHHLAEDTVPPHRGAAPEPITELSMANLHNYFYQSFTISYVPDFTEEEEEEEPPENPEDDWKQLAVVACVDTDFEAWVVALHRITSVTEEAIMPSFPIDLEMDFVADLERLRPAPHESQAMQDWALWMEELVVEDFCRECHIPLKDLYEAMKILFPPPDHERLYLTLYEVRIYTGFDLMTAQRLYELLRYKTFKREELSEEEKIPWFIERRTVWIVASAKYNMLGPGRIPLARNLKNKKVKDVRATRVPRDHGGLSNQIDFS